MPAWRTRSSRGRRRPGSRGRVLDPGALGYVRPPTTGDRYLALVPADGAGIEILLQRVDDAKQGKNRLHLDLRTPDLTAEVTRVRALGATLLTEEPIKEHSWTWHILADPDANEFCILQPPG
ncbi:VOC family protein [Kribbella caucasensis]|uniref:VOC family protein n=1 Tax=Kribbella caucasensis TaxID=2512215 RepID=UPI00192DD547